MKNNRFIQNNQLQTKPTKEKEKKKKRANKYIFKSQKLL